MSETVSDPYDPCFEVYRCRNPNPKPEKHDHLRRDDDATKMNSPIGEAAYLLDGVLQQYWQPVQRVIVGVWVLLGLNAILLVFAFTVLAAADDARVEYDAALRPLLAIQPDRLVQRYCRWFRTDCGV